jgi:opacity protein-like surface antigen
MTRLLTSIAVAFFVMCGVAGLASAAGLPVKAPPVPPPPPAVGCCDWTGVYIGAHYGYGWGETDITLDQETTLFPDKVDKEGWLLGVHLGANVQVFGNLVFGAEFSLSKTDIDGSKVPCFAPELEIKCFAEDQWLLLGMLRAGLALGPSFLGYITGGVAVAGITTNLQLDGINPNFERTSVVHDGWAAGFGFEYQLPIWGDIICCRHFVLGAEYVHVNLVEKTHENVQTRHVSQDLNILRLRVSYKFGQTAR